MSFRTDYQLNPNSFDFTVENHQIDYDFSNQSALDIQDFYHNLLAKGMHGLCFSMYEDGQKPGDVISEEQVRRRLKIMAPYCKWVRSFSCIEGNEFVPKVAKELGMKTLVGAWLGNDAEKNEKEIEALIQLAKEGLVDIAAAGNEVMYRKDLTEDELIQFIKKVRKELPAHIPVGYVDAYYEFTIKPKITEVCDVILTNCYPFWEGTQIEHAMAHMNSMYHQAKAAANGKPVIITETGWPSQGESFKASQPSEANFKQYFIQTQLWANREQIPVFYFASFDESWKTGPEGEVGAHWGIWDKNEKLKFI